MPGTGPKRRPMKPRPALPVRTPGTHRPLKPKKGKRLPALPLPKKYQPQHG